MSMLGLGILNFGLLKASRWLDPESRKLLALKALRSNYEVDFSVMLLGLSALLGESSRKQRSSRSGKVRNLRRKARDLPAGDIL